MKKIEAVIRTDKLEDIKEALSKETIAKGLTVSQVLGHGNQLGFAEYVRGQKIVPSLLAKVKIEIVVRDEQVEQLIDLICQAVRTGEVGDGKIFVLPVEKVIRIRTGQEDAEAL
ncbi:P-II family nitrogen regulator [Streptococcus panodentis]|uniref:Transcriptional regulator n=1 Tax=Streptococcus panodentis TaxID=1581472 RepID=A0ABS5AXC5_9STRE|nr:MULTISPECIES: P-II family nitrogen regulator [Streptococcus]KXT84552.1 Nitrogen regulatory protein P-II [Streptococcus sp. DD11]MBP2620898.1 transcriptional regulator [Streptococcus panodentis]